MRRLCLSLLVAAAAACGPNKTSNPQDMSMTPGDPAPPPDDFDLADVPAAACVGGWLNAQVPRQGNPPRFALAPDGTWHLWYLGFGGPNLSLQAWRHVAESAPSQVQTLRGGAAGTMAVAPDGTPDFFVSRPGGIERWHEAAAGWVQDADSFGYSTMQPMSSLIDAAGHAHVAFAVEQIYYGTDRDGPWSLTTIPMSGTSGPWNLLVDGAGSVYLFFTGSDGNYFATNAGGAWATTRFPSGVYDLAVAIDSARRVHAVWQDGETATHLTYDAGKWTSEPLPLGKLGLYDMRLDGNDNMHVLFGTTNAALSYANNIGGTWTQSVVNPSKIGLRNAKLGLDGAGKAHIAYSWKLGPMTLAEFGFARPCP